VFSRLSWFFLFRFVRAFRQKKSPGKPKQAGAIQTLNHLKEIIALRK
jgi:hypothetical protein